MRRNLFSKTIARNCYPIDQSGFTLIELVMVIVLIGVLSVGASSLFSSKDAYVDYLAKERLLSLGLLAQQLSLGVSAQELVIPGSATPPLGNPSEIRISRTAGGAISFTLLKHQQTVQTYNLEAPLPAIAVDGSALSAGSTVTLAWDQTASMTDAANHSVTITGASTFRVCVSASGYTYESAAVCP
jgi:MSHA pilin protein MshC